MRQPRELECVVGTGALYAGRTPRRGGAHEAAVANLLGFGAADEPAVCCRFGGSAGAGHRGPGSGQWLAVIGSPRHHVGGVVVGQVEGIASVGRRSPRWAPAAPAQCGSGRSRPAGRSLGTQVEPATSPASLPGRVRRQVDRTQLRAAAGGIGPSGTRSAPALVGIEGQARGSSRIRGPTSSTAQTRSGQA